MFNFYNNFMFVKHVMRESMIKALAISKHLI